MPKIAVKRNGKTVMKAVPKKKVKAKRKKSPKRIPKRRNVA